MSTLLDASLSPVAAFQETTVAAVDLGSNSFHLLIARIQAGHWVVLDRLRESVRLAEGLDEAGHLNEEAQERALLCLQRFGQRLRGLATSNVRVVGTNTFRVAHNNEAFLQAAAAALDHPIEIISGIEEARLIYSGVVRSLPDPNRRRLVIDIGGGSTELIIGEQGLPLKLASLFVGCVTLSQRGFPKGIVTRRLMENAELSAALELEPVFAEYQALGWEEVVGASGTLKAVENICRANGWSTGDISRDALEKLKNQMISAGHFSKLNLPGIPENRAPVLAGGVAILSALFQVLGLRAVKLAEGALREGLLHDLLGRIRHEDTRSHSVMALAQRFQVDPVQARRVADTARRMLLQAQHGWGVNDTEAAQFLDWAAQLHEIGLMIAFNRYHKHGAYILANTDLAGFSWQDQQLVALLVRAHRRSFPASEFAALPGRWQVTGQRLAAILRLAVILHRNRDTKPLPDVQLGASRKGLRLEFPQDWLAQHPLTQADLYAEGSYLQMANFSLEFI